LHIRKIVGNLWEINFKMIEFKEKYINPFTGCGFKRLFGEEPNNQIRIYYWTF